MLVELPDPQPPGKVRDVGREEIRPRLQDEHIGARVAQFVGEQAAAHAGADHDDVVPVLLVEGGLEEPLLDAPVLGDHGRHGVEADVLVVVVERSAVGGADDQVVAVHPGAVQHELEFEPLGVDDIVNGEEPRPAGVRAGPVLPPVGGGAQNHGLVRRVELGEEPHFEHAVQSTARPAVALSLILR
ncbi:hypothetical protein ACQPZX_20850 [Actinoplanes sp. CA-142083]|uniref:hypothetical protein n=1 Tax=Actinoplanes sp. CA-142083 TaxID=3239903 RepID=UPI003D9136F3